jgi:cell division protein FtsN
MPENSRKFLWLAAAVSLFTLVVIGAAFLIFAPGKTSSQAPFDLRGKAEARQDAPQDYLANPPEAPSITQTTSAGDIIIVYGNDPSAPTTVAPASTQQKPATTTIVVSPQTTPATPATTAPAPAAKAVASPTAKAVTPQAAKPVTTTTIAKVTTTTKAPAKIAAPTTPPQSGDFWIQAGSFSVKDNADSLKSAFAAKSLPAVITVKDIDGKSRYIVRVGPYSTRTEASKWLSAAKSVKGAEQAWITQ